MKKQLQSIKSIGLIVINAKFVGYGISNYGTGTVQNVIENEIDKQILIRSKIFITGKRKLNTSQFLGVDHVHKKN